MIWIIFKDQAKVHLGLEKSKGSKVKILTKENIKLKEKIKNLEKEIENFKELEEER